MLADIEHLGDFKRLTHAILQETKFIEMKVSLIICLPAFVLSQSAIDYFKFAVGSSTTLTVYM